MNKRNNNKSEEKEQLNIWPAQLSDQTTGKDPGLPQSLNPGSDDLKVFINGKEKDEFFKTIRQKAKTAEP